MNYVNEAIIFKKDTVVVQDVKKKLGAPMFRYDVHRIPIYISHICELVVSIFIFRKNI